MKTNDKFNQDFGGLIQYFRHTLGLTQEKFGNLLLLSRATVVNVEKTIDINDVSNDILFRLYYFTSKVIESDEYTEITILLAQIIHDLTDSKLIETIYKKADFNIVDEGIVGIVPQSVNDQVQKEVAGPKLFLTK